MSGNRKDNYHLILAFTVCLLSSAIYSIYYSRYSTPYLSGEGEEGGLLVVVVVVREQETLLLDAIERQVYILLGKRYRHSYTA